MEKNSSPAAEKEPDLRIVLVGKTGVGKSAAGNRILRSKLFPSHPSFSSVTSTCKKETNDFNCLNLAVIDTPGLFDTDKSKEDILTEIAKGICMAAPGPHVFLIVLQLNRFTPEEKETLEIIQKMFGEKAAKYTMILFTHGDVLKEKNIEIKDMLETSQPLKQIISQCAVFQKFEDKYHVFDNKVEDPGQVSGLVEKIIRMVQGNGGSFYTNEMFEEAQRAKQEEMERLIRENPYINPEDAKRQAETENAFIRGVLKGAGGGAVGGAVAGVTAGFLLKVAFAEATAADKRVMVAAAVGGSMGAVIGAAVVRKKKACIIQ